MKLMPETISGLFSIRDRFVRSAHLERDFHDPSVLSGYVATDFVRSSLTRISAGLKPTSGQRAWRMTGDYGSGKSSFALLLAHCFAGRDSKSSPQIRKVVDLDFSPPNFVPVLVTCARQSLAKSIIASLSRAVHEIYGRSAKSKISTNLQRFATGERDATDDEVLRLLLEVNSRIILDSKGKGLLLILDELGKYLEYAALRPEVQDVFLLQRLAEAASRSRHEPLFVVSIVHQGFDAYADRLNQSAQREWQKVAGRFDEIVFDQPIEQTIALIASALNVRTSSIPKAQQQELAQAMDRTIASGWLGPTRKQLSKSVDRLYPLHPTVLPVLIRSFRRFGQNERSIFSFLLSNEPFGLRSFSERPLDGATVYRLHDFYDYIRINFGHRLAAQSYRSHWNLIDSIVDSFSTENEVEIRVLKTVGILNLLNDTDLIPTEEALVNALTGRDISYRKQIQVALQKLHRSKRVLYDRGRVRGLCLWPHTSVDLEKAYDEACRAIATPRRVATIIKDHLETRPIVARRHYIETGNLRHCDIRYCSVADLISLVDQTSPDADGTILAPLCETTSERKVALQFAKHPQLVKRQTALLAVSQPLNSLVTLVQEVQRWEWISANTIELNGDKYAREEVSRQKAIAAAQLKKRIDSFLGFRQSMGELTVDWFHQGKQLNIRSGRELLERLSEIFDEVFEDAPHIHNELVNRRDLSSAAAAARMRLIERMFANASEALLGMDPAKKPPEMSMYLSVLQNAGIHQRIGDAWRIDIPKPNLDAKCGVHPSMERIKAIVQQQPDARVNVGALFEGLRRPPYGVRDGLIPLLLAAFAIAHEKDVAFYKDGTFLRELNAEAMLLLSKAPERFDIQFFKIQGVRAELFEKLVALLQIDHSKDREVELLDVVKHLCVFVAELPPYVRNTKKLLPTALSVRDTILSAREPATLLFTDLPKACGFNPISSRQTDAKEAAKFIEELRAALDDLRMAYPQLEERLRTQLRIAFELPGSFQAFRTNLAQRAEQILLSVTEPKLRAFCLRLIDDNLPETDWLESIGSYLALKPPSKWHDADEDAFNNALGEAAARFHRVESIVFSKARRKNDTAIRLAVTRANGIEHEEVVHFGTNEEERLRKLEREFEGLFAGNQRLALAAASRAIWNTLESNRRKSNG
jgi:hypothetical protein